MKKRNGAMTLNDIYCFAKKMRAFCGFTTTNFGAHICVQNEFNDIRLSSLYIHILLFWIQPSNINYPKGSRQIYSNKKSLKNKNWVKTEPFKFKICVIVMSYVKIIQCIANIQWNAKKMYSFHIFHSLSLLLLPFIFFLKITYVS